MVPTSVSLLATVANDQITACTISSLVSVNINNEFPAVLFVMKKGSITGYEVIKKGFFTINLLGERQASFAEIYSSPRVIDQEIDSSVWISDGNFVKLINTRVTIYCKFYKKYCEFEADIFIGSVVRFELDQQIKPLIYNERTYCKFIR